MHSTKAMAGTVMAAAIAGRGPLTGEKTGRRGRHPLRVLPVIVISGISSASLSKVPRIFEYCDAVPSMPHVETCLLSRTGSKTVCNALKVIKIARKSDPLRNSG